MVAQGISRHPLIHSLDISGNAIGPEKGKKYGEGKYDYKIVVHTIIVKTMIIIIIIILIIDFFIIIYHFNLSHELHYCYYYCFYQYFNNNYFHLKGAALLFSIFTSSFLNIIFQNNYKLPLGAALLFINIL